MPRESRFGLYPESERTFSADVGAPFELAVRVLRTENLSAVRGAEVRFDVICGALGLGPRRRRAFTVRTGSDGRATVPAIFSERGAAIVAVDRVGAGPDATLYFGGHSDGTTHRLVVTAAPEADASVTNIVVHVTALDHHARPVAKPDLVLEANSGSDLWSTVRLRRLGRGEYAGILRRPSAGCWRFRAQDRVTKVIGDGCAQVLPGTPHRLVVVEPPDPRRSSPFGEVWLRARLEDRMGNPLDPRRIRCVLRGAEEVARANVDGEARFLLRRAQGHGAASAKLSDVGGSGLRIEQAIRFAAAWIEDPGFVAVDSTFRTPLYVMPPPGRPLREATVTIAFDPKRAKFLGLEAERSGLAATTRVEGARVVVDLDTERPIEAASAPDGIRVGYCSWTCRSAGQTCFTLTAAMSPESEPWKLCITQKRERQKCICVNIINKEGDLKAVEAGDRAMQTVISILSTKNIKRCCPSLRREPHHCRISAADWRTKVMPVLGAGGVVRTHAQVDDLFKLDLCQRKKCINFLMIPMDHSYADGDAGSIGPRPGSDRSFGVINPDYVDSVHNIGAHEVGHALGLDHVKNGQDDNVMSETQPHGDNLTAKQCEDLWKFLAQYACS